jgi:hypothetical protein
MKTFAMMVLGLGCAALTAYAASSLRDIPFVITSQSFEPGDSIIVQRVTATSPNLKVGDTVIVQGTYHLQSRSRASLGFFLTTNGPSERTPVAAKQKSEIASGDGTFHLEHIVPSEGRLHVSFYPRGSGSSFGGVYFGPVER